MTDDAKLLEEIVATDAPTVEAFSSLYDTQGGTILAISFGLTVVVVIQLLVTRIFSGAKSMVEALTFFATAMVSVLVAVYLCDLLIAGPDVLLLRDGERSSIVSFIEDICLMTFAYFFGTKTSSGGSNDAN
ncbi:MAG: hypothetical protein JHD30_04710 [Chloroflexi bacterium]|nr:hypothetical protein [Chloroflexota bacterium]